MFAVETPVSASVEAAAPPLLKPAWRQVWLLNLSHFLGDGYISFYLPLMPLLAEKLGFDCAKAMSAVAVVTILGSVTQPFMGHLCERRGKKAVLVTGLSLSVLGASLLGLAWSYGSVILILAIACAGLSCYHPAGAALAAEVAGGRRGLVMSIYTSMGNFGVMAGPVVIGALVGFGGLRATLWALPVGVAAVAALLFVVRERGTHHVTQARQAQGPTRLGAFGLLVVHMFCRNVAISGLVVTLPWYCKSQLDMTVTQYGLVVGLFTLTGTIGGYVGGHLSDHFRRRPILIWPALLSVAPLLGFLMTRGWVSMVLLGVGSMMLWSGHAINVVLGQEYLPRNQAVASGVTLGLTWGLASLTFPLWGAIGDAHGMAMALTWMIFTAPVLAAVLAVFLPHTEAGKALEARA